MKKILTIILDGFGIREEEHGNAIKSANMNFFNTLWNEYPHSLLKASEEAVGLHEGQFGNSECGHETIGAGRLIKQNETIVDDLFESNLLENEYFNEIISDKTRRIHIMGLTSDGCVHADINDIINMYNNLVKNGCENIYFHVITDGRDTSVHSALSYIDRIQDKIKENKVGSITTICGRYYAMDRDNHWDRIQKYYYLVTKGEGISTTSINDTINKMYENEITDEFLKPILVDKNGLIRNGDILIWMNYRADRAKQIISTFVNSDFDKFRTYDMSSLSVYSMLPIDDEIPTKNLAEYQKIDNPLGIYLSKLGLTQARIAETEKFPHVTYFFDGGYKGKITKCNFFHIPSPQVATYDLKPEMSAIGITKKCMECMIQDYDFILVNFANTDMVGHTGNYDATVNACIAVDICLKKIIEIAEENFYKVIILADHGNADIMIDDNGEPVTTHTCSKVPFIITDKSVSLESEGDLTMVAPTILEYMDISVPDEMKDTPILIKK